MARGPIPDKPKDRPSVAAVSALVSAYLAKPGNEVGGSLHIVLDDGNIDDDDIAYCIEHATKRGDDDGAQIGRQLLQMTRTQRKLVYRTKR